MARRRGALGDDPRVVDARQGLVGEQPAERIGAQAAVGGERGHAETGRPDGDRARSHRTVGEDDGVAADLGGHVVHEHGDAVLGEPLGGGPTRGLRQKRSKLPAADQRHLAALLGELGGHLGTGEARADDGYRSVGMHLGEAVAQPFGVFEFAEGMGEFGVGDRRGCRAVLPTA